MPQTKLTPRKEHKCPMCTFKSFDMGEITKHITECGLRQMEKKYPCDRAECSFTTNKLGNLNRHRKRHLELDQQKASTSCSLSNASPSKKRKETILTESALSSVLEKSKGSKDAAEGRKLSDDDWENADPGDLHSILGELSETESEKEVHSSRETGESKAESEIPKGEKLSAVDEAPKDPLQVGRILRKPTSPMPVLTPKRKEFVPSSIRVPSRSTIKRPYSMENGTQTDVRNVRKVEWTITKWREGDKDFEHIVMIEEDN